MKAGRASLRAERRCSLLMAVAWLIGLVAPLAAIRSMTAAEPSVSLPMQWTMVGADCDFRVLKHQAQQPGHDQDDSAEHLRVRASAGTYIHVRREVSPSRVLEDLQVGVWIKSDRRGLQVFGRIVLPESRDPRTGEPVTVLLPGGFYDHVGRWQQVHLVDTPKELQRQRRVLQGRLKRPVSLQGAYLDAVVVNVFGGPATTNVWLDTIEQRGRVAPDATGDEDALVTPVDYQRESTEMPPRQEGSRLMVNDRPFLPLVVEYHGESWELLRQLGFNTVYLPNPPTAEQYNGARQAGLWLLCPPPAADARELPDEAPILAWYLGDASLSADERREQMERLRRPFTRQRPLVAMDPPDAWKSSRDLDILLRRRLPLGTSFELSQFGPWLQQASQLARPGTPFWTVVQTELPSSLTPQIHGLLRQPCAVPRRVGVEQVRQLCLAAVAAGSRGLWFASETSLEENTPDQTWRRWMLERILAELSLIEPWAMGGRQMGTVVGSQSTVRVHVLSTERSRLLIPSDLQPSAQLVYQPHPEGNTLVIPGVPDSTDVYVLTPAELLTAQHARISGGVRIELSAEQNTSLVVLTEDPLVVTHLNRVIHTVKPRIVELEQMLSDQMLRDFEKLKARELLTRPNWVRDWDAARSALQTSRRLSESGDFASAYRFSRRAQRLVSQLETEVWRQAVTNWEHPLVLPMGAAFPLTTLATDSVRRSLAAIATSSNRLPGGDCEQLDGMIQAGWAQASAAPDDVETYVALSPDTPHGGKSSLRLVARAKSKEAEQCVLESPPVWIQSAPIAVEAGQILEITGWVRIDEPIAGSLDGLMIHESLGGEALALRFAERCAWRPFRIVRAADRDGELTLTFALTGLGEAWVDDIKVAVKEPPAP